MKKVVVLGCTGSIGRQTMDVLRANREDYQVLGLCAGQNSDAMLKLAKEFSPEYIGMSSEEAARKIKDSGINAKVTGGRDAACELAVLEDADIIVNGVTGFFGMRPLLAALKAGKVVALANKESIVCAHSLVDAAISENGGSIIPIDSEQTAIFQCLNGGSFDEVQRLILTASGGPFRTFSKAQLEQVTPEQAAHHPNWNMGRKITIDSAGYFNKGLEVIEASYLFHVPGEKIDVLVHPESVIHSMVEFCDGSNIAQLAGRDMRIAIQYALSYPRRTECRFEKLRLEDICKMSFYAPDTEKFPAIPLAYEALKEGQVLPIVYNGANEKAVELFVQGKIRFTDIPKRVEYAMFHAPKMNIITQEDVMEADKLARELAAKEG